MSGISWLVYHYADSGEIYQVTGVPGIYPSDGAQVDLAGNEIVRHLMKDDLETLGFQNPSQFVQENSWNGSGWDNFQKVTYDYIPSTANLTEIYDNDRKVIHVFDMMGRETSPQKNKVLIYQYSDGTTERIFEFD